VNEKFEGVVLTDTTIHYRDEGGAVAGANAIVGTAGDIDRRITATRLILTGPFAFGLRKKKDKRELYLTVEGSDFAFVVEVNPKKGADARKFAAKVNSASKRAQPAG
jgi:hypothetical protein